MHLQYMLLTSIVVVASEYVADLIILVVLQVYLVHLQHLAPDFKHNVLIVVVLGVSVEAVV